MRSVYRLLGLVRLYGPDPVEAACSRALNLDVVSVTKIASMLGRATEHTVPVLPAAADSPAGRFARDPAEYSGGVPLTLIPGGQAAATTTTTAPEGDPSRPPPRPCKRAPGPVRPTRSGPT